MSDTCPHCSYPGLLPQADGRCVYCGEAGPPPRQVATKGLTMDDVTPDGLSTEKPNADGPSTDGRPMVALHPDGRIAVLLSYDGWQRWIALDVGEHGVNLQSYEPEQGKAWPRYSPPRDWGAGPADFDG